MEHNHDSKYYCGMDCPSFAEIHGKPEKEIEYPKKDDARRKITLYRDDSTTQVVYENVKHVFWTAGNTVFVIAQYTNVNTGEHRYIQWPRERFCWFKDEKQ